MQFIIKLSLLSLPQLHYMHSNSSKIKSLNDSKENPKLIEKLNGSNYHTWKIRAKNYLIKKDLWRRTRRDVAAPIPSDSKKPTASETTGLEQWEDEEDKALATLQDLLVDSLVIEYSKYDRAYDLWNALEKEFAKVNTIRILNMKEELANTRLDQFGSIDLYLDSLNKQFEMLFAAGHKVEEIDKFWQCIKGLPAEYDPLKLNIDLIPEDQRTMETIKIRLSTYASIKCSKGVKDDKALKAKDKKRPLKKFTGKCFNCDKIGHKAEVCYSKV